ncbi:MAG: tRNA (5-methylaminomethyl-2-thiouridine)(34)-methyltransferase MnmD [Robiginitomaculum sp.]|nr:tRNA (5-methylaminomethyl-2-thiouridine)(34)-methyltransferase MnmD [Robiginitomaculum sp.]
MSAPKPLTATPPALLSWSENGEPVAENFDDVYFSVDGGLAETKAVFLQGCGLPDAWQGARVFVIGEHGFGSGLNFLAAWALWLETAKSGQRLHFLSVEAFPLCIEQLRRALDKFPTLKPLADQLIAKWPDRVKGVHRLHFGAVVLTLFYTDIDHALVDMDARINAWFLDGFSPAKNPNMWSDKVFVQMAKLSAPLARVASFTVAGHVRRGLAAAGFTVEKKPGFGRKRERLEAVFAGGLRPKQTTAISNTPVIIGGGIAGASLVHAFNLRGITPTLIEPHSDLKTAASGNPAGLVMPKLDLQDRPESRFYNAAYLYALSIYRQYGTVLREGVLHMATSEKEAERFAKIAAYQALPEHEMRAVTRGEAESMLGHKITTQYGGLYFPSALTISPLASTQNLSKNCTHIQARTAHLKCQDGVWQVLDGAGEILAKTDALFVCNGANIQDLWSADVRFTRGQICWGDSAQSGKALIAGNYAAPYENGMLLGATHDHVGAGENTKTNAADTAEIIAQYAANTGQKIDNKNWQARAAVRVTTRNTLPIAGQAENDLFVLSGLGSRGLMMAPLLGEALVCKALGEPSPLDIKTQMRFGLS